MKLKATLLTLLVILFCGALLWLLIVFRSPTVKQLEKPDAPDAFMSQVVATLMNQDGDIAMTMAAPKLVHYENNDTTEFDHPALTLYRHSPSPWLITANHAKSIEGMTQVDFNNQVVIHHAVDSVNPETTIQTDSLNVNLVNEMADTADPITLAQPNITVHAIGLHANMLSGDIKLLSDARGEYAPTH